MEKEYEVQAEAYATEYAQGLPVATAEPVMGEVVGVQGSSRQFVFRTLSGNRFDGAGAIQNLPRNGVEVDFSADAANYYSRSTGHRKGDRSAAKRMILAPEGDFSGDHATQWSLGATGAWFSIRLVNHALRPTHYVYRGDMGGGGNHPRTWTLEASGDGQNWTRLREHRNDSTVTNNSAGGWPLEAESYFSYFRIRNCGPPNHLCCSGVDLYGDLVDRPGAGAAPATSFAEEPGEGGGSGNSSGKAAPHLNRELNDVARNTDDVYRARSLVQRGADLSSTNGAPWHHTPLHQASYHGRYAMAETLVQLGAPLHLHSNPCGRGRHGTPLELARGGGHHAIAEMLERAACGDGEGQRPNACPVCGDPGRMSPGCPGCNHPGGPVVDPDGNLENELTTNQWSAGIGWGCGPEAFAANPWRFNADHTFVTERDGCHGTWYVSGDKRSLRMDWQDGQRGNYAEFLRRPGFPPTCDNVGSSYGFMRSWSLTLRGGGVARQEMDRGGGCGSMSPDLLNGCWVASVCPIPFIWAIYHNQKVTDDRVRGEQASVGIARPPQRREPFPRRQRLRLLVWHHPDPLR